MIRRLHLMALFSALLTVGLLSLPALADNWPTRPVTIVVPFGAGGNTDMMARLAAQDLSQKFGQNFLVENRPSPGGVLALREVVKAEPDGYTLLFCASSMITLTPQVQNIEFDPMKQLVPITNVGTGAQVMAIKRSLPATNLPEFLSYAKANPGKLNFSTAGVQNLSEFMPVRLFKIAGVDLVKVPARAEPQAISDLMSGVTDVYFGNASSLLPLINNDQIRLIAVSTPQRLPAAPNLPTVAETVPGFESSSWNGFLAPVGTPAAIVTAIRTEVSALVKKDEVAQRLANLGIVPGGMGEDQIETMFHKEHETYASVIKIMGIEKSN
ncbi:MAG TPA: tripartite tricarboxylate transporter substrate binding protein [Xanthobacteraceae bacterium]|nr:tripartite tricarboxylate transporter substrate binding protein [Xanthobacteraceae bacterium]